MIRTWLPTFCALSAITLGACSQQNADFMPGGPPGGAPSAPAVPSAPAAPLPAAAQRASMLLGLPVRARSGAQLGAVFDIVFGNDGQPTHLIVVHTIGGGMPGTLTAIPWAIAIKHFADGALVVDAQRFAAAPGFAPDAWPKLDSPQWSAAADAYWSQPTAPPFTPVDPTTRSRARPAMIL